MATYAIILFKDPDSIIHVIKKIRVDEGKDITLRDGEYEILSIVKDYDTTG